MAFSNYDDDEVMSEINMTPLVDVMLVLLIIFIVTVPVLTQTVRVELPKTEATSQAGPSEPTLIAVDESGNIFWNKEAISKEVLSEKLNIASKSRPQPQIQIQGDRKVDYEHVVRVMALTQKAGIREVGFVTEVDQ